MFELQKATNKGMASTEIVLSGWLVLKDQAWRDHGREAKLAEQHSAVSWVAVQNSKNVVGIAFGRKLEEGIEINMKWSGEHETTF